MTGMSAKPSKLLVNNTIKMTKSEAKIYSKVVINVFPCRKKMDILVGS